MVKPISICITWDDSNIGEGENARGLVALTHAILYGEKLDYAFLFVIVWWAWFNGTFYHDLHGNNDIRTRVITFLQMLSVVAMAVFAHDALGESSVGLALSYAAFQVILTYLLTLCLITCRVQAWRRCPDGSICTSP